MSRTTKKRGIIGQLYNIFKKYSLCTDTTDFFTEFLYVEKHSDDYDSHYYNTIKWSSLANYDYFDDHVSSDLNKLLANEDNYLKIIEKKLITLSPSQKEEIEKELLDLLKSLESFSYATKRNPSENDFRTYDSKCINLLNSYFTLKKKYGNLCYNIYLLIYFSLHKHLPGNFFFGIKYKTDLAEFNEKVICKYGATSKPGVRAIISLAEREKPNLFALYEYADMLYYGSPNGPQQNLHKAFKTYKQAAGISKIHNTIDSDSACNPLALWSLAYIYLNYRNISSSDLGKCEEGTIPELDGLTLLERIEGATHYAKLAIELTENATAANILGRIVSFEESDLPGITKIKEKYQLKSAQEYFSLASQNGYVYATNNFANIELEKIFSDPTSATKHMEQYISYLDKSAKEYEPWAANTLGQIYLSGEIKSRKNKELVLPFECNKEKAKFYFYLATEYFNDYGSSWAYMNLILNYPEDYIHNSQKFILHNKKIDELENTEARRRINESIYEIYEGYDYLLSIYEQQYSLTEQDVKVK